jgi:hypothetical protein
MVAKQTLGETSGKPAKDNKENWWWTEEEQNEVEEAPEKIRDETKTDQDNLRGTIHKNGQGEE